MNILSDATRPHRRLVLVGAAALTAPAFAPAGRIQFEVRRGGRAIGRHEVRVVATGEETRAVIEAEFQVKIGPVPVYRYRHAATEIWRGGRFATLSAVTVENGKRRAVEAQASAGGVRVAVDGRETVLDGERCPLTHWNLAALQHPLFNAQTGAAMSETVARHEGRSTTLANGRAIAATEVALAGSAAMTDWYEADGTWAALSLRAPDGSTIEYRRL